MDQSTGDRRQSRFLAPQTDPIVDELAWHAFPPPPRLVQCAGCLAGNHKCEHTKSASRCDRCMQHGQPCEPQEQTATAYSLPLPSPASDPARFGIPVRFPPPPVQVQNLPPLYGPPSTPSAISLNQPFRDPPPPYECSPSAHDTAKSAATPPCTVVEPRVARHVARPRFAGPPVPFLHPSPTVSEVPGTGQAHPAPAPRSHSFLWPEQLNAPHTGATASRSSGLRTTQAHAQTGPTPGASSRSSLARPERSTPPDPVLPETAAHAVPHIYTPYSIPVQVATRQTFEFVNYYQDQPYRRGDGPGYHAPILKTTPPPPTNPPFAAQLPPLPNAGAPPPAYVHIATIAWSTPSTPDAASPAPGTDW
ncbi:hypothetical protein OH76DRAFT_1479438 [Lentinus brumalis]|uniref:Zn(2)-C6 fungal-type domain-containing protein n=1 Tax=Lentinus brumalis TaxID=2498619 RepID=A0A371DM80_9APHY|nr:hypothetical protein OH76DRAFT_1479438 [Polyporus brumalis]